MMKRFLDHWTQLGDLHKGSVSNQDSESWSHKPLFLESYYETPCNQEILRNGFDKLDGVGVTHLDLAAHGTVII